LDRFKAIFPTIGLEQEKYRMKEPPQNKLILIFCFLSVSALSMYGQKVSLKDYLIDYSKKTQSYEIVSDSIIEIFRNSNDSAILHLNCDMPVYYFAKVKYNSADILIEFDALNVWSDETYINQFNAEIKYSLIFQNNIVVICGSDVIELLKNDIQLKNANAFENIGKQIKCPGLIGTGIIFGISVISKKYTLKYFHLLRSR
jgi:hypothetical protein